MIVRYLATIALVAAATLFSAAAHAQHSGLTLIVPFPAGGVADISTRSVVPVMEKELGVSIVVENVPGATGNIGIKRAMSAPADGKTLVFVTGVNTANLAARPAATVDIRKHFDAVGRIAETNFVLTVSKQLGVNTVDELIALAKQKPGTIKFGSTGPGSNHHLLGEMLMSEAKISLTHIPYRGEAPAIIDLLAGRLDLMFLTGGAPYVNDNRLVGLGVTAGQPWFTVPQLKPLSQLGLKNFVYISWNGLMAPKGTPAAEIKKLNAALNAALKTEQVHKTLAAAGAGVGGGTPEDMTALINRDMSLFERIIREQKLKFD
jgi:tripartite-type tricarboxylate transporter receptor subunit TctC